jgi:hypothetical protein
MTSPEGFFVSGAISPRASRQIRALDPKMGLNKVEVPKDHAITSRRRATIFQWAAIRRLSACAHVLWNELTR